jgi:hypothetical protein
LYGFGAGGNGSTPTVSVLASNPPANSGAGGTGRYGGTALTTAAAGASGYCLISYWS